MFTSFRQFAGRALAAATLAAPLTLSAPMAQAQDPFIGSIQSFGFNFCPRGWAEANGQILAINQNQTLYSLFGTTYGGDGRTSFGLPDLRGRSNIFYEKGPGLSPYVLGQRGGAETITLTVSELPSHSHTALASTGNANARSIAGSALASGIDAAGSPVSGYAEANGTQVLNAGSMLNSGGNQAHDNMAPYLTIMWCVALEGLFPSRS